MVTCEQRMTASTAIVHGVGGCAKVDRPPAAARRLPAERPPTLGRFVAAAGFAP